MSALQMEGLSFQGGAPFSWRVTSRHFFITFYQRTKTLLFWAEYGSIQNANCTNMNTCLPLPPLSEQRLNGFFLDCTTAIPSPVGSLQQSIVHDYFVCWPVWAPVGAAVWRAPAPPPRGINKTAIVGKLMPDLVNSGTGRRRLWQHEAIMSLLCGLAELSGLCHEVRGSHIQCELLAKLLRSKRPH